MKFFLIVAFLFFNLIDKAIFQNCSQSALDLVLVIDSSGSIEQHNFDLAKNAVASMINNLDIGPKKIKVGIINYSDNVLLVKSLVESDQDKNELLKAVNNLVYFNGMTATGDALKTAYDIFYRNPREVTPRVAVLFTDGYSNTGANVITEANRLKNAEVTIFSIGITSGINMAELNSISSTPSSKYVKLVKDYSQLYEAINEITMTACATPIFLAVNRKVSVNTQKNELKKFQIDLKKFPSPSSYYEIEVTNVNGFTNIDFPSFLTTSLANVKAELFNGPFEKLTKNGEKALSYFIKAPSNALIMYFDTRSREATNDYNLLVSNY